MQALGIGAGATESQVDPLRTRVGGAPAVATPDAAVEGPTGARAPAPSRGAREAWHHRAVRRATDPSFDRRVGAATLTIVLASACADRDVALWLPLPPHDEGARSMLLATESDRGLTLRATTLDAPLTIPEDELTGATVRLVALLYDETLDVLQLPDGPVPLASVGQESRAVPDARRMYATSVPLAGDAPGAWEETLVRGARLEAAKLPALVTPCPRFEPEVFSVETSAWATFLTPLGPTSALLGTADGLVYRVDASGATTRMTVYEPQPLPAAFAGGHFDGRSFWTGRYLLGRLDRGIVDGDAIYLEESIYTGAEAPIHWITGSSDPNGTSITTMDSAGVLRHWDGARVVELDRFPQPPEDRNWWGGLVSIDRRESLAVLLSGEYAIRVRDAVATRELVLPQGSIDALQAVAHVPGLGDVTGTSQGELFVRTERGWESLIDEKLRQWIFALHPYENGFLFTGAFGTLGYYEAGYGLCPLELTTSFDVRYVATLGADVVLAGNNPNTARTPFVILRRRS